MAKLYLPFAETLYDQDAPVGDLGRGTHYSVLRVLSWTDKTGMPTLVAGNQDVAVVWDEDHDVRVMGIVERLYAERLLYPVMFIGERKGSLTVIIAPQFASDLWWFRSVVESMAQGLDDPWGSEVSVYPQAGSIINAEEDRVVTYLKHIDALWHLGFKPRRVPIPVEFGVGSPNPFLRALGEGSQIQGAAKAPTDRYPNVASGFARESQRAWLAVLRTVLGAARPEQTVWTRSKDIERVLALVAHDSNCNHMLLPSSGGMDLEGVQQAGERGCLALVTSSHAAIVRPAKLTLECLSDDLGSSYFRLDVDALKAKSRHRAHQGAESLLEIRPGEYVESEHMENGHLGFDDKGKEIPIPKDARQVARYFRGPFILVGKSSPYNGRPYDDLHVSKDAVEFRALVERVSDEVRD